MSYKAFAKLDPGSVFCPNDPRRQFILRILAIEGRDLSPANIEQVDNFLHSIEFQREGTKLTPSELDDFFGRYEG